MQIAAHPCFAAGVAFVGAGAIALSPVAPPMPDIAVPAISSAQVKLSAATDPVAAYLGLITNTFTNVTDRIGDEIADPAPILRQIVTNQVDSAVGVGTALTEAAQSIGHALDPSNSTGLTARLQQAFDQLLQGDVNKAVSTAWGSFLITALGLFPVVTAITNAIEQPVGNLDAVLKDPSVVLLPAVGVLSVVYGSLTAAGNIGQNIVDAAKVGDALGVLNEMVAAPAVLTNAVLNGPENNSGIFGSDGLIAQFRAARDAITRAITPAAAPVTDAAAAAPKATATTVTLDVSPQAPAPTSAKALAAPAAEAAPEPDETVTATADSAAAESSPGVDTPVVKKSLKAEPGKIGNLSGSKRTGAVTQLRDGIQGSVAGVSDGLTKAAHGLSGTSTRSHRAAHPDKSSSSRASSRHAS